MKMVVVVQARMGSTRLPGKVLLPIAGRPMLAHVLERALAIPSDGVLIVTSDLPADDPISALAVPMGVQVLRCPGAYVRGTAHHVLLWYRMAAEATKADILVRLTGDCPLIDPTVSAWVIARLLAGQFDYAHNTRPGVDGLDTEVFTAAALRRSFEEDQTPWNQEHVTPYLRDSKRFRVGHVEYEYYADRSDLKLSVDTPDDYARIAGVFERLPPNDFTFAATLKALWP